MSGLLGTWKFGSPTCARCGIGGAEWIHSPRGGHLALCGLHMRKLVAEMERHEKALTDLLPPQNTNDSNSQPSG